jgi:TorA maturation chaperone TorD
MQSQASRASSQPATDAQDQLRAQQWNLLARLLAAPPGANDLRALAQLSGDSTPLGRAYEELAAAAGTAVPDEVAREYHELFIGVGRGELLPYGSFYLTGFLNERPLAELRRDLAAMGVERAEGRHEPEDHVASLCEVMAGLAGGSFDAAPLGCGGAGEAGFFARHLEPWVGQFFDDLAGAPSTVFYRSVAGVGRTFCEIEARAFALDRAADMPPAGATTH